MRLFHLGWLDDRLYLWGEASDADVQVDDPSDELPRACRAEALTSLLEERGLDPLHEPEMLTAWLPTVEGAAVPSSSVLGDRPDGDADPTLAPWRLPALPLDRATAVDLLGHCHDRRTLAPGQLIGNDLSYWAHVIRYAGAMVAREQFLPGLQERDGTYRARWEPVVRGEEAERVATLVETMPPGCRALARSDDAPPDTGPRAVFLSVLGDFVDFIVRAGRNGRSLGTASPRSAASFDSLHDQWLHALRAPDGRMEGNEDELAHLSGQLRAWRRRIEVTAGAAFRLVFRLEEPDVDEDVDEEAVEKAPGPWHVRYLLQSTRDPSLQIDVAEAWDPEPSTTRVFERADFQPESYLLAALGQAMGVWPAIEESLKEPNPAGLELDTEQAHNFLREYAPLLRQTGFGVQLPAWWKRGRTKETLSTKATAQAPDMKAKGGLSLDTIVQFDWEVALGDHVLSREELDELAEMKTPLVRLRGEWVEVDLDAIREVADRLGRQETDQFTAREVMNMALGARDGPGGLSVETVSASGALGELLDRLDEGDTVEPLPEPDGFNGTLRPYQERGYAWLAFLKRWGLGACLADDMGLGKTIQALALLRRTYNGASQNGEADAPQKPSLVVCPTSVVSNWKKEAGRFTPGLSVLVHHGSDRDQTEEAFVEQARDHHLVVTNYALLRRDVDLFRSLDWDTVVLDEAQYVKNPSAQRTRAARSLTAQHRIAMTGTPVENNVGELWSIMEILNPGLLGSQRSFKKRFFRPIQNERDVEAMRDLKRITGPFILRREKTDPKVIDDLPEKQEMTVYTSLTEEQVSLYQAVVKETTAALEGEKSELDMERRGLVLSTLTQLKQICNHPAQYLHDDSQIAGRSGKLSRLVEMLEEMLASGERALIFTQFTEMGEMLKRHLQETFGREALFLHGGVKQEKRDRMVERFQEADDPPPFFLLSLKAGGTGLNLTRANHVFHYDRWWNPAVENQATDRAFRIGQTKRVQVHKFVCAGTLEERIDEMIDRKKALADQVVDAGEAWVTELSTDELKDLFRLRLTEGKK